MARSLICALNSTIEAGIVKGPNPFYALAPRWWSCERKKKYDTEPVPPPKRTYAYKCRFCDGWHLATEHTNSETNN